MSETLKEHKYHSLEEVLDAVGEMNWWDLYFEDIEDNEENRQIVEDCLFWCGVEFVRFTYSKTFLRELTRTFKELRESWNRRKDSENHDD
jgi:hypothetical protein